MYIKGCFARSVELSFMTKTQMTLWRIYIMSELTTTLAGLMSATNTATATTTKKQTELWLNIVFQVTDEQGNTAEISLPYGLDLTNMPSRKVGNSDSDFNKLLANQNFILEQLRAQGNSLPEGERVTVSAAKVELYREMKKGVNTPTIGTFNFGLTK